jgi:phosphoglycerate dehydrogenase-like enzyme
MRVVRWGRSAYETAADLASERAGAEALGLEWAAAGGDAGPTGCDALVVTSGVKVTGAILDQVGCRLVITTTSGYDHVDADACAARGVALLRLPEARRDPVVEQAVGHVITLMRGFPALEREAVAGRWARGLLPELAPVGLSGSRVVVVGLGVIGSRMVEVLRAFGAAPIGVDPAYGTPDLDDVLDEADAVTLHCSLTKSSRGLLGSARLDRLAPHAVVVNTSRGEVLDVEAAVARVRDGRLRGLACDVFPVEPYPALAAGAAVPGVLFTPHSAGFVRDLGQRVARGVIAALSAWVSGDPLPHRVV